MGVGLWVSQRVSEKDTRWFCVEEPQGCMEVGCVFRNVLFQQHETQLARLSSKKKFFFFWST